MVPELARLSAHGLSQEDIARALGVTNVTVSRWMSGARQLAAPYLQDARELLAVLDEDVTAGRDVRDTLQEWTPAGFENAGGPTRVGSYEMPGDEQTIAALMAAWNDPVASKELHLQYGMRWLCEILQGPRPLSARRIMQLRRGLIAAQMMVEELFELKLQEGQGERHGKDIDQR
jgi:transcriptional regulator with XRE-family HTH domain